MLACPGCLLGIRVRLAPGSVAPLHPWPALSLPHHPSPFTKAHDDIEHFETAYVVKLFKFHPLAPTQVPAAGPSVPSALRQGRAREFC